MTNKRIFLNPENFEHNENFLPDKKPEKQLRVVSQDFLHPGKDNNEERSNFISFWVRYMKTHSDEEWSRQQNMLINSVIPCKQEL